MYMLNLEVVQGEHARESIKFFIRSDVCGLPSLEWLGEGQWRRLLSAFGLEHADVAGIDTQELLYRPLIANVKIKGGKNYTNVEKCNPEEQETALEYIDRVYPMKE